MEPWRQAYQHQFGSDADDDMAEHADEIEEWRISWQAAYDAGEAWATAMVGESGGEEESEEEDQ